MSNSSSTDTLEAIAGALVEATLPLRRAVTDLSSFRTFLHRLGWRVNSLPPQYQELGERVDGALAVLESLRNGEIDVESVLTEARGLYEALKALSEAPDGVDEAAFLSELQTFLFDLLVIDYLAFNRQSLFQLLRVLGVIEDEYHTASADRPAFLVHRLRLEEAPRLLKQPGLVAERVFGWGTANFDFDLLAGYLLNLMAGLRIPAILSPVPEALTQALQSTGPLTAGQGTGQQLTIRFLEVEVGGQRETVGLNVIELAAGGSTQPGIFLMPLLPAALPTEVAIGEQIVARVRPGSELDSAFGVAITPEGVSVRYPFDPERVLPSQGFSASIEYRTGSEMTLLGRRNGTRLVFGGITAGITVDRLPGGIDFRISISLDGLALILKSSEGDNFLQSVVGSGGATIPIPLTIQWSNRTGLGFAGGAGFDFSCAPDLSIGPIKFQKAQLSIKTSLGSDRPPDLITEVKASLGGQIGPIAFSVDDVGLGLVSVFRDGNAGPLDIAVGFKPPNGVGLSIDKAGVSGGGYLYLDKEKGQYAGVVQLNLQGEISVKGIGLIATRLPDNSKGFSLLVIITAEDFKPIPLPLGFKLTGIGGLLAINRTFDEEVLRAGLKSNTLDSVLFPKDPVRNAPQIISNLNKVFPIAKGHHLFGPVAQISWGAKGLLTANLALALELGERLRLLILAQIAVILPRPENDLIRLKMDAVGVIDFDRGTASLDATLHDSRLLKKFTLTGDMAMRLKWEDGPNFALAVGGLHPAFNPPPNFPKLERVAINLSSGDNPRIRCEAYFALTSNTVQFGARAELYAKALGFSVHGDIGFDVLIQFDPFQFLADFHAQVQLKRGSRNLFKVRLEGELSGPRPLRIKAKATFEVLWMDVSFRVDKTLVSGERPEAPAPVEVMPLLKEALGDPGAWAAKLPAGGRQMVTLRATPGAASDVLLHPLGALTVKQNVVPLNMEISRFGHTTPAGERRFAITDVYLGETRQTAPPTVKDFFARAQYIEMSDGEKLSAPSFEPMTAGVAIGSDEIAIGDDWLEVDAIRFETIVVNKEQNESRRSASGPYELKHEHLEKQSRYGAAGASELRRSGRARYRGAAPKYRIVKEGWSIAATSNLTEQPSPVALSYSEAAQALRELKEENPAMAAGLKILRPSELQ